MPSIPPRTLILVLGGGMAALLLGAFAARGAASSLVSPVPMVGVLPGILAWFMVAAALVFVLGGLPMPRLARRLLMIGTLAVSGWSIGTIGRALYVTLAFAFAGPVEEEATAWQLVGIQTDLAGPQSFSAWSPDRPGTISVPFDGAAVQEISGHFMCFELPVERTQSGVERVRLPDEPLGVDDLAQCPAVRRLGDR
ncbi:MAG: hypothetical protein V4850_16570 [Myxococcota bacterium]